MNSLGTVTVTKDLKVYLQDVKSVIKKPDLLLRGRKIANFPILPREAVGLFLICAVINEYSEEPYYITTDPQYGDGALAFKRGDNYFVGLLIEQTSVTSYQEGDITDCVVKEINKKTSQGQEYGKGRNLVIFLDKVGEIDHERIQREIKDNDTFLSYWLIGLAGSKDGAYTYFIATLKSNMDPPFAYSVKIKPDFKSWEIKILRALDEQQK